MSKDFRQTLYTVDEAGHRKWVYSSLIMGRIFKARSVVAYGLMAIYLLMPWISINGKQGVLLDFLNNRFIFLGVEFWATDTYFLFLVFGILAFSLFFFTSLLGRVWCGWACPETVFLEFLFRPIERLIEGTAAQRKKLDEAPWTASKIRKKFLRHSLSAIAAWIIASTFLAYFIGREPLIAMMNDWPQNNLVPFLLTLIMMGLMAFQFGWFREQFCTVLCPYARFQSVLMDSESLVVGYDVVRGEPRAKGKRSEEDNKGDCVDCGLCVRVCPTGIDIRNGLQLECVACTSCIDACNSIMKKVGKPEGLIRYDTENRLLGRTLVRQIVRPRPVLYGVILLGFVLTLGFSISNKALAEFQIVRGSLDAPFSTLSDGRISNHLHARISNRNNQVEEYRFSVVEEESANSAFTNSEIQIITPETPLVLEAGQSKRVPLFFNFPKKLLTQGRRKITIEMRNEKLNTVRSQVTLLGPDE